MNKDNTTGEIKSYYKLRSSLKKLSRNTLGSLDASDGGQDVTMAPPARRVSFAASSTIKPFAYDPEKNTIWDNTYEEEITNFTDSNNVISSDSHTNLQETKGISQENVNVSQPIGDLQATLCNFSESSMELTATNVDLESRCGYSKSIVENNMEFTCQWKNNIVVGCKTSENKSHMSSNCTQYQEIDMSLTGCGLSIADKENIQTPRCSTSVIKKTHSELTSRIRKKKSTKPAKPFGNNSLLMKTMTQPSDMELTCQFDTKQVNFSKQQENMPQDYEPMEVDETSKMQYTNQTVYQEVDMSITCKFNNHIIDKENVFPPHNFGGDITISGKSNNMEPTNINQAATDMEFNCLPEVVENQEKVKSSIHFSQKAVELQANHHIPKISQKASCSVYQNKPTLNSNQSAGDMEFTCNFSEKVEELQISPIQASNSNSTPTVGFPSLPKKEKSTVDMELTCRLPEKAVEPQISTIQASNSNSTRTLGLPKKEKSTVDMELTCHFSEKTVEPQISYGQSPNSNLSRTVNFPKKEKSKVDMKLTCHFPEKAEGPQITTIQASNNNSTRTVGLPKKEKSTVDMELTCHFPEKFVEPQISYVQASNSNSTRTVNFPKKEKSTVDMELTCHFSEKAVGPQISTIQVSNNNSTRTVSLPKKEKSTVDLELTCHFPEKAVDPQLRTDQASNTNSTRTVGFPSLPKMEKSTVDMELICRFPEKPVESQISTVQASNSHSTRAVGFPSLPKMEKATVDMQLTCCLLEKPVESQISTAQVCPSESTQTVGFPTYSKKDKTTADMEFTCLSPEKAIESQISTVQDSNSGSTRTMGFPEKSIEPQRHTVQACNNDSCQIIDLPPSSKRNKPTANIECRIPEKAVESKSQIISVQAFNSNLTRGVDLPTSSKRDKYTVDIEAVESQKITVQEAFNSLITQKVSSAAFLGENQSSTFESALNEKSTSQFPQGVEGSQMNSQTYTDIVHKMKQPLTAELEKGLQNCHSITQQASFSTCVKEEVLIATQTDNMKLTYGLQQNYGNNNVTHNASASIKGASTSAMVNTEGLKCNFSDHSNCSMDLTHLPNKTIVTENNSKKRRAQLEDENGTGNMANDVQSVGQETTSVLFLKPQLHTENVAFNTHGERSIRVREFGNIPIPIDCSDLSIDQSIKSKATTSVALRDKTYDISQSTKYNSKSTTPINNQEKTYSVANQQTTESNIFDNTGIKNALKSVKDVLYQYYDQDSGVEPIRETSSCRQEHETHLVENSFKNVLAKVNINETIDGQECSLIDALPNISDEDLNQAEIKEQESPATPPKVIYSEPMKVAKPWTSMLDFSGGFSSSKKPYSVNSITSMDGTQQLIEATFSQPFMRKTDTPKHKSVCRNLDPYSAVNKSTLRAHTILDNIHEKIVQYQRPQFDYEECTKLIREHQALQDKVRRHQEEFQSPQPRNAVLDAKVKRLSLANTSYDSNSSNSSLLECLDEDEVIVTEDIPKNLHERIVKVFNDVEDHMLKLEHSEENYYVCSTFARCTWFDVELHPEDGRVTDIKAYSNLKTNPCSSLWPRLYEFIVKHTMKKLQMDNLRSSLGSCFDMLSLLDHVNMIAEKNFDFCTEFINANRQYKTLKLETDATVSFQILVTEPPIWWEVEFVMASVENIQQDSLKASSKWGRINEEHLKTILRNTEPGLDCVKRFVGTVAEYFQRTQLSKFKLKDAHKLPE